VVGIRQIDVGNIISPSNTNGLVVVTQLHPISLIFTLPETSLPQIQQQQQTTKTPFTVFAYNQDNTMRLDQGQLGLVNNEILQTTGSIQLKANFDNKANKLWPGELVNARLLLDTRHNGLTVPAGVVQQGAKGPYAWVVNPDNTVAIRSIKVAQISDGEALIDSGLSANEQVVADGQYKLQPGTHVTLLHGQAAQEQAAQDAMQAPIP
jgi:multidrug efflux system membrane fusion protein